MSSLQKVNWWDHLCPICKEYMFRDCYTFDICPVCGFEDGPVFNQNEIVPGNWISITEGQWIWRRFHVDVNMYAIAHKKQKEDPLPLD